MRELPASELHYSNRSIADNDVPIKWQGVYIYIVRNKLYSMLQVDLKAL